MLKWIFSFQNHWTNCEAVAGHNATQSIPPQFLGILCKLPENFMPWIYLLGRRNTEIRRVPSSQGISIYQAAVKIRTDCMKCVLIYLNCDAGCQQPIHDVMLQLFHSNIACKDASY